MTSVTLGYKAFDPHELLPYFIAREAGLFSGLSVALLDISFVSEKDLPRDCFQASCGAALASAVQGMPQKVLVVATDRPMFWLYSRSAVEPVSGLKGKTIAAYAPETPPAKLTRIILNSLKLDPEHDVTLLPARDDISRSGLLRSGHCAGAVLSSAMPPPQLQALGCYCLAFFGDFVRIPTTGIAIDGSFLQEQPRICHDLAAGIRSALQLIHTDIALVRHVLEQVFNFSSLYSNETAKLYQQLFTVDGKTTAEIAGAAVATLAASMGMASPPRWQDIYLFNSKD